MQIHQRAPIAKYKKYIYMILKYGIFVFNIKQFVMLVILVLEYKLNLIGIVLIFLCHMINHNLPPHE